jgi:hypothetical protein
MQLTLKRTISKEMLSDVFVTALEGGSNYWYYIPKEDVQKVRKVVPKQDVPALSEAIFLAVIDHGVDLNIHDAEDNDTVIGVISSDTILNRLQKLADSEEAWAIEQVLNEDYDANSADVIFQYITLGEVVYG